MTPGIASLNPGLMSSQPFGLPVCTPEAFYERGCQKRNMSANRPPGVTNRLMTASPVSVETKSVTGEVDSSNCFITTQNCLQKLKSEQSDLMPTIVLSEPRGLPLFQVVRGGIE